jgi:hypothetical protein
VAFQDRIHASFERILESALLTASIVLPMCSAIWFSEKPFSYLRASSFRDRAGTFSRQRWSASRRTSQGASVRSNAASRLGMASTGKA